MIRITTQPQGSGTAVIVDGWVAETDLEELQRVRHSVVGRVALRLAGVGTCVPQGISLFQAWLDDAARLENASPFLDMVLRTRPPVTHAGPSPRTKPATRFPASTNS